jgi:Cd2+/Zn2+-exporting ATPase
MSITQNNECAPGDVCCGGENQAHNRAAESNGCSCCQTGPTYIEEEKDNADLDVSLFSSAIITGAALFVVGFICEFFGQYFISASIHESFGNIKSVPGIIFAALFLASYVLIGKDVVRAAALGIIRKDLFNENTLMAIASIGAFVLGEYPEAVAVMLFYNIGEYLQDRAVDKSRSRIRKLLDIRPDTANLIGADGSVTEARAEEIEIGASILVRPGERVPLDGVIESGESYADMSALTGESAPVDKREGDDLLAGSVNGSGVLTIKVTKPFGESTASRIISLVEHAEAGKAKTESFITRFARVYTPIVVGVAVLLAVLPPLFGLGTFANWIQRGLVFLVVSCPCALVISIPVGFFGGIGAASASGILVKGGNYLESLAEAGTVVFDKTGTLTTGVFHVASVTAQKNFGEEDVLRFAAIAEKNSTHPIARSIVEKYNENAADIPEPSEVTEKAGLGISALHDGKIILAGNRALLVEEGVIADEARDAGADARGGTAVYIAVDGVYAGVIELADTLKSDSAEAIEKLHASGISRTVMLTGDRSEAAEAVRAAIGVTEARANLMPWQKVEAMEEIMSDKNGSVIFMGDGINDAPVLARADVGIAMGALGADAAIEAADIVIMDDKPSKLVMAIAIARKTRSIVRENVVLALGIKGAVLVFAALGFVNMWVAVFADVGVALLAVANALRAGSAKKP